MTSSDLVIRTCLVCSALYISEQSATGNIFLSLNFVIFVARRIPSQLRLASSQSSPGSFHTFSLSTTSQRPAIYNQYAAIPCTSVPSFHRRREAASEAYSQQSVRQPTRHIKWALPFVQNSPLQADVQRLLRIHVTDDQNASYLFTQSYLPCLSAPSHVATRRLRQLNDELQAVEDAGLPLPLIAKPKKS